MGLKFRVKVPGTSANIGVGYDCLGVALDYFLELEVEESDKIEFLENGEPFSIPIEENLIFEAIKYTEKHLVKKNQNVLKTSIPKLLFSIKKKTFFVKLKNKIVIKIFLSFILYLKYFVLQGYFKKNIYSLKTSILRLK